MTTNPWLASFTRRWHTNPNFRDTQDCVAGHSGRVAIILMMLDPNISGRAMKMAVIHDLGEESCGDVAAPFKWANPDFAARLKEFEAEAIQNMGFDLPELDDRESSLISVADALDAYLWASFHRPRFVSRRDDWRKMYDGVLSRAEDLGVREKVVQIVKDVSHGKF